MAFGRLVTALATRNWEDARKLSSELRYKVATIQDSSGTYLGIYDPAGKDAAVVLNLAPRRDVVFEAPHVPFEVGTAEEAVLLLQAVGARAALISGAHRCASLAFAGCSGTTEVCGRSEGYRDADVGHNPATLYEVAHEALTQLWPRSVAVSLHGMRDDLDGVKTSMVISSGAHGPDAGEALPATRLRTSLGRLPLPPGAVVSCNVPADAQYRFRKLCGFTNVQGRFSNHSADICSASAEIATGRFIHIEQDWSILQPFAEDWRNIDRYPAAVGLFEGFSAVASPIAAQAE
jgi:hypothetical protein